jgi:hypothetical protein
MMLRKLGILIGVALLLTVANPAYAQEQEPVVKHSAPYWNVAFWNNMSLSGNPVLQMTQTEIDFEWGSGSPQPSVPPDRFSARWARYIDVPAGDYRFTATSDDGIRVYVDSHLIINGWYDHSLETFHADIHLAAGHHLVVVEYYENMGHAVAKLSWAPVTTVPRYWRGEYYSNPWLGGSPVLVRDDQQIDFNWGWESPAPGIPMDQFSVRWTRTLSLAPGMYSFTTTTDDGVRLWVNDHLLIDRWWDQPLSAYSGMIYVAGDASIKMEYYERGGIAAARLMWEKVDGEPTPEGVVVDDTDRGFVKGGTVRYWTTAVGGYGGSFTWTRNNDWPRHSYNWARWYPDLQPGRYEVFVHIPDQYATTARARYWISHTGGHTMRLIDQSSNRGRWVSLGMYQFRGTSDDYVSLADVTYETWISRYIAFDAVKWVPR